MFKYALHNLIYCPHITLSFKFQTFYDDLFTLESQNSLSRFRYEITINCARSQLIDKPMYENPCSDVVISSKYSCSIFLLKCLRLFANRITSEIGYVVDSSVKFSLCFLFDLLKFSQREIIYFKEINFILPL